MSDDTTKDHKENCETCGEISRRVLLAKAALVAGGSAASVATVQTAFARSSDVSIDSSGKVKIDGAIVVAAKKSPTPKRARDTNGGCLNVFFRCADNVSCVNTFPACATQLRR
jgi:hypothetical protein